MPDFQIALDLLFANKGLIMLAPVLGLALAGLVLLHRRGLRAETYVIAAIFLVYLTYNSGYWLPFGGGSPGPRFLVPVLPFLAIPLALAWKRWPATALGLAAASVLLMATATMTLPLLGNDDIGYWAEIVGMASFEHTLASIAGLDNGWVALAPFLLLLLAAAVLAARATGPVEWRSRERLAADRNRDRVGRARRGAARVPRPRPGPREPFRDPARGAPPRPPGIVAVAVSTPLRRLGRASPGRSSRSTRTPPVPSSGRSQP